MATRKTLNRGTTGWAQGISSGPARLQILLALPAAAAAVAVRIGYIGSPAAAAADTTQGGDTESNALQDLTTDSQYVADYLKTITGPVVLVGHSYGGTVLTNAAAGLANVKALVYVDASAPAPGETNGQLSGATSILSKDSPAQLFSTTTYPGAPAGASELYLKEDIFVRHFASDLPRAEAERLGASQRGASTAAFSTPPKYAAWKSIPSWYSTSSNDQIITAASELGMTRRAHSHITIFHGGSHLTLISHPNAVTAVIASAVCSLR